MVDRGLRDQLAEAIHAFAAGYLTTDEFDDRLLKTAHPLLSVPGDFTDGVIGPVSERAWCLYSDTRTYRLVGKDRIGPATRRDVLRWVLFLHSDREYEWPLFRTINPAIDSMSGCLLSLATFGFLPHRRKLRAYEQWRQSGDEDVWPFFRRDDYDAAARQSCPVGDLRSAALHRK